MKLQNLKTFAVLMDKNTNLNAPTLSALSNKHQAIKLDDGTLYVVITCAADGSKDYIKAFYKQEIIKEIKL